MTDHVDFRSLLRDLPVLKGKSPTFDVAAAPSDPVTLFQAWLRQAVDDGVLEPHAMTLSTVDADGAPDARALIVKDVDDAGWHFAVSAVSPKGAQLSARPQAALTFYWPQQVRQVRVRGTVVVDGEDIRRADFQARSTGTRAMALTLRQSQPFSATDELDSALRQTTRALADEPELVPDEWQSFAVQPLTVEFWQGDPDRKHQRLRYRRQTVNSPWTTDRLWP